MSAGTYVCNHLFYRLMHLLNTSRSCRGGFIHVPPEREGLRADEMAAAISVAVATALSTRVDLRSVGGAVS